jgi:hypothetical protein
LYVKGCVIDHKEWFYCGRRAVKFERLLSNQARFVD